MSTTDLQADLAVTALEESDRAHLIHPYLPTTTTERVIMTSGQGDQA